MKEIMDIYFDKEDDAYAVLITRAGMWKYKHPIGSATITEYLDRVRKSWKEEEIDDFDKYDGETTI